MARQLAMLATVHASLDATHWLAVPVHSPEDAGSVAWLVIAGAGRHIDEVATKPRIHRPTPAGAHMSDEDLRAELARLQQENAALKQGAARGISMKVSEKGGLSIYGLGRFPVTLYKEQWTRLLDMSDEIRQFIAANEAKLKTKE
jgi:hypothetical protein